METPQESVKEYDDKDLERLIRNNKGFVLIGMPLSGKTLFIYSIIQRLDDYMVVIPDGSQPVPSEEVFGLLKGKKVVLVLDNISIYADSNYGIRNFTSRLRKATNGRFGIASTCREGGALSKLTIGHGSELCYFLEFLPKLRLNSMSPRQRCALAQSCGIEIKEEEARKFPHPGNITMREQTRAMKDVFRALSELSKDTLRSIKMIDASGMPITISSLYSALTAVFNRSITQEMLDGVLKELWDNNFLNEQPTKDAITPHFGYIEYAVSYREGPNIEEEYLDIFADALEKDRNSNSLMFLIESHRRREDIARLNQLITRVLLIDPENARAHYIKGYSLARAGNLDEALNENGRALEICPTFAEAFNNRAYIFSRLGQFGRALEAVDEALKIRPDYDDAHTNRAILLARLNRFPEAMEEFGKATQINPENYYVYLNLGITLSRQGLFKDALSAFSKALELRPDYPELYLNQGITYSRMNNPEKAFGSFEQALRLRPEYFDAYLAYGQALAKIGDYLGAIKSLTRALELHPEHPIAHVQRGRAYARMGPEYIAKALDDWRLASDLGIKYPRADLSIAISLAQRKANNEALAILNRIIDAYPEFSIAYYYRGRIYIAMDNANEALDNFNKAIELAPSNALAHCNRGFALANLGRPHEAHQAVNEALKILPELALAHFARGYIYSTIRGYDRVRLELALAAFEKAIEIRPAYPEAHKDRGFTLGQLGRDEEALEAFTRALELRPYYAEAIFGKARSLCFLARNSPDEYSISETFNKAMELLERAASIDASILERILKDRRAFIELRSHPDYQDRFYLLIAKGYESK